MKHKILKLLLILWSISLIEIKAQPYIYYSSQISDTSYGQLEKIVRYNLSTNSVEDFLPQQNIGEYALPVCDPSQAYLSINVFRWTNTIYDCSDTSNYFELGIFFNITVNEILYSPQRNNLYIFSHDYEKISVLNLSTGEIISEIDVTAYVAYSSLMKPRRNSFFSADGDNIYFYSLDTLNRSDQVWTYSLETNEITEKRDLIYFSEHSECDGYSLTFGKDGMGIIEAGPFYNNPVKDFYFNLYDFENDIRGETIYHSGISEAYFSSNGEFLLILGTNKDTSDYYYHTGDIEIYETQDGQLIKTLTLPSGGEIYTFDNYPNNVYYAIDIEEPTRQIYTLKMDSIFNVLDLTSLNPSSKIVNSPPFMLTVNGNGFDSLSTVYFNDTAKTTTYVTDSVLTAEISTSDISVVGNYPVWVTDEWETSDTLSFSVVQHPPVLTSISPAILLRNTSDGLPILGPTVTASGANFSDSSVAYFNGNAKTTTVISDSELTFTISGSEMSTLGNYPVWISNYGSNSDTLTFSVTDNLPQSLTPTLQCVRNNGGGSFIAYFGYNNNNSVSVYVPLGSKNKFSPTPIDRGQPKLFLPGSHTSVFSVNFNGRDLTWTLDQASVIANSNSTPCP